MNTKSRGLPGTGPTPWSDRPCSGWAAPICLTWLICVPGAFWLNERGIVSDRTLLLLAVVLPVALGIALATMRRTTWILFAVPTASLLVTLVAAIGPSDPSSEESYPVYVDVFLGVLVYSVMLGVLAYAGALVAIICRPRSGPGK